MPWKLAPVCPGLCGQVRAAHASGLFANEADLDRSERDPGHRRAPPRPCRVALHGRYGAGSIWIESRMPWSSARSAAVASGSFDVLKTIRPDDVSTMYAGVKSPGAAWR